MRITALAFALPLCVWATVASGQTADDVELIVAPHVLTALGAETREQISGYWSAKVGNSSIKLFSMSGCGNFRVTTNDVKVADDATYAWRVELTPTKIVDHATTFRLRWTRIVDKASKAFSSATSGDMEVTLKPGESRPFDSVPVPEDAKTFSGKPCDIKSASLRVSSQFPVWDNRRIAADLWLVEKFPSGTETRQSFAVVGIPHQPIPFYLPRIGDVDLFGTIVSEPESSTLKVDVEIVRAEVDQPPPADGHGYQAAHWDRSTTHVKADDVIEIPLPKLEARFGPYANRDFALRVKVRRVQ